MRNENRTDRILILIALMILLMAGGAFYFDSWMWGGKRDRGDVIGLITKSSGDVRLKMEGDLKWQKASDNENLVYNDAVYAGGGSEAQLSLGESKMTVTENTLVVLRRDQNVNFMNLNYGTLFGRIAKNERLIIDTGKGKPIEFNTAGGAEITLSKTGGVTQLDVKSGTAELLINGERRKIDKSTKILLGEDAHVEKSGVNKLKIVKPVGDQIIYSDSPVQIPFAWAWEDPRLNKPDDQYALEFSATPQFKTIHATKNVDAQLTTMLNASKSLTLYFRVKGPENSMTTTERIRFVRLSQPLIVYPQANQRFRAPLGQEAAIPVQFEKPEEQTVWYQISDDPEFKNLMQNQSMTAFKTAVALPVGQYYIRARGDFGDGKITAWSETHPFAVDPPPAVQLTQRGMPTRVVIPNRAYPARLYNAADEDVRYYLRQQNFMGAFFRIDPTTFDEMRIEFDGDSDIVSQSTSSWPERKLNPDKYMYRYQLNKEGLSPSDWSARRPLQIVMEPPKPVGQPMFDNPDMDGNRNATWNFTPLLFAGSYDVEVAGEPGFRNPQRLRLNTTTVQHKLASGRAHFWRARARDKRGNVISDFSAPQRLNSPASEPKLFARNNDRRPQAAERVRTKVERIREDDWVHNGWWAWAGVGMNFTDYRQSIPNGDEGASLSTANVAGPSAYMETGYTGGHGWGGVFTYKRTPGEILFTDGTRVDNPQYTWTTVSMEGILRRMSNIKLLNRPMLLGFRAGIQQHKIPFIVPGVDADLNPLASQKNNNITTASLGLLAEMNRKRWMYYWLMRYQFPLSTSADGANQFEITPTFAFDGSVGMSYNFTDQWKVGVFWYGQWHQFNFKYNDGTNNLSGFQSLFYSSADARIGFDF